VRETNLLEFAGKEVTQLASKVSELGRKSIGSVTGYDDIEDRRSQPSSNEKNNDWNWVEEEKPVGS
jgi:hypothetical protein